MTGLVPDVNIEGQVLAVVTRLRRPDWAGWWDTLDLEVYTFHSLGWPRTLPDREVWGRSQAGGLVLITENRNHDGPDSLEATLRDSVGPESLPVITISDKDGLRTDPAYAERVAVDLLELLLDIRGSGRYVGAGRVFLPLPRPVGRMR